MPVATSTSLKALLVYDADREIDASHPRYNEIMLFAQSLAEVHVAVCIKHLPAAHRGVSRLSNNVFVYYLPRDVLWRIDEVWRMVRYHLFWHGRFRPDVVVNISSFSSPALFGCLLAKRYKRPLCTITDGLFLDSPRLSLTRLVHSFLARASMVVVVQTEAIARRLERVAKRAKVCSVPPAVDLSFLDRSVEPVHLAQIYPQHHFFLMTYLRAGEKRARVFATEVFRLIRNRFPRMALVVVTPQSHVALLRHYLSHVPSVYVCPETDTVNSLYAGANLFLSVSTMDTAPIIRALGLHIPVVAVSSESVQHIFSGSPYTQYVVAVGDVPACSKAVLSLIGNQYARDDYRLNAPILLQSLALQTPAGYVATIISRVHEAMNTQTRYG